MALALRWRGCAMTLSTIVLCIQLYWSTLSCLRWRRSRIQGCIPFDSRALFSLGMRALPVVYGSVCMLNHGVLLCCSVCVRILFCFALHFVLVCVCARTRVCVCVRAHA